MHLGLDRTRREMLVGGQGPLAKVEAERRLVLEAGRGFERAVREARAEGLSWEKIAEYAPGFTGAFGAEAAEKLFESVSVRALASATATPPGAVVTATALYSTAAPTGATRPMPSPVTGRAAGASAPRSRPTSPASMTPIPTTVWLAGSPRR